MRVLYFSTELNEKKKNIFIKSKDVLFLANGMIVTKDNKSYEVVQQTVKKKAVIALCSPLKYFLNETSTEENPKFGQ